jgi:hypothetical protein
MEQIEDLLQGLEKIAQRANRKVVLFIDEFQDILKVEKSSSIQAAIRSVKVWDAVLLHSLIFPY